ncbi:MAG TPA: tetratricopeptide repeat protein [Gemmataceae bacterium]|nr:tetratricopeptide repeat protein [Gemmataceae bacterium]
MTTTARNVLAIRFRLHRRAYAAPLALLFVGLGGCASPGLAQAAKDAPPAPYGVVQAQATETAPADPTLKPTPKYDPTVPSFWNGYGLWAVPKPPPPPADSFIVRPDGLTPEKLPETGTSESRLVGARDLFRRGEYATAQQLYHSVGNDSKTTPANIQEGLFYEAECLRMQGKYPAAADTYNDLLNKFANTPYRDQAVQHMFDIANYWLDDTRKDMEVWQQYKDGKQWYYWPQVFSWDKTKPVLDEQGRAVEKLEQVRLNDINGPLADQSLFYAGSVAMYNKDWRAADNYFTQIYEHHPNSPLAPKAIEYAIMAKNLSTGGPEYDGRKAAEARKLVDAAFRNYPEYSSDPQKAEFLTRQLQGITLQQAAKDFGMAEFWEKQGHPGAAYFQYGVVKQRYPNTTYAAQAETKMQELAAKIQKTGGQEPPKPPTDAGPAPTVIPAGFRQ